MTMMPAAAAAAAAAAWGRPREAGVWDVWLSNSRNVWVVVVRWVGQKSCSEAAIDGIEFWMFERISSAILVRSRLPQGNTPMSDEETNEMEGSDNDQSEFEIKEEQNGEYAQSNIVSMIHSFRGMPQSEACEEAFEDDSGNLDETVETELMDDQGNPADHERHISFPEVFDRLQMLRQRLHEKKAAIYQIMARLASCSHVVKIESMVNPLVEFFSFLERLADFSLTQF